jgi:hypothetical protein
MDANQLMNWFDFNGFTIAQYDFILGICESDDIEEVHHFYITQTLKFIISITNLIVIPLIIGGER